MNMKELKLESLQIEDSIYEKIEHEKWRNELSIIKLCIAIASVMIFVFTPIYFLLMADSFGKSLFSGYLLLSMICGAAIVYYLISYKILSKKPETLHVFRIVNIAMESLLIAFIFYVLSLVFGGLQILSGPVFLMFVVINLLSLFRLSFGSEVYSSVMGSLFYLIECLYIAYRDGEMYPEIYSYDLIFKYGVWLNILFFIVIGIVCGMLSKKAKKLIRQVVIKNYETSHIKLVFGKYVSPEIRDYILETKSEDITKDDSGVILFCDINNFSEILDSHDPKNIISQLNVFFEKMDDIISKNGGVINKFVGSCVMAVFGLGKTDEDKVAVCESAVKAAKEIQRMTNSMNDLWNMNNFAIFNIGIGVSQGQFITGNIGSENRKEFTCLGDVVNVASRLQSKTRSDDSACVLVAADVFRKIENEAIKADFKKSQSLSLKGKSQPVEVYSL